MNPCPCGNLFSTTTACRCSDLEINRYKSRLSDPFLDRIDLYVQMHPISSEDKSSLTSRELHKKVRLAFVRQKERGQERLNGALTDAEIAQYCPLDAESQSVVDQAIRSVITSYSIHYTKLYDDEVLVQKEKEEK